MLMSDQNSYEMLGLDESSSFDEIQAARDRLLESCGGDRKQMESIEAAYDAILMERLRLRQEGKIKVPDRIRFAEETPEVPAVAPSPGIVSSSPWLTDWLDTPSRDDLVWPAGIFSVLAVLGAFTVPSLALAVGVGCNIYFLNRKEYRFWRAILLTIVGLILGLTIGIAVGQLLASQGVQLPGAGGSDFVQVLATAVTLLLFWGISSFLR
jgi:hypothetical protein